MNDTQEKFNKIQKMVLEHVTICDKFEKLTYYEDPRRLGYILECSCGHNIFFSDRLVSTDIASRHELEDFLKITLKRFAEHSPLLSANIRKEAREKRLTSSVEDPILSLSFEVVEDKESNFKEISIQTQSLMSEIVPINDSDEMPIISLDFY